MRACVCVVSMLTYLTICFCCLGVHMHQNHTPNVPPYGGGQPPHHNIMVSAKTNSMCSSDSEPEEESAFAKALRQKKLKKANSTIAF